MLCYWNLTCFLERIICAWDQRLTAAAQLPVLLRTAVEAFISTSSEVERVVAFCCSACLPKPALRFICGKQQPPTQTSSLAYGKHAAVTALWRHHSMHWLRPAWASGAASCVQQSFACYCRIWHALSSRIRYSPASSRCSVQACLLGCCLQEECHVC